MGKPFQCPWNDCSDWIYFYRTTTNVVLGENDDITEYPAAVNLVDGDEDCEIIQPSKRRRNASGGQQIKIFETIAKTFSENQSRKLEMFQKAMQPQGELELFFASVCKTVEKFSPLEQAKIKMEMSRIVSQSELEHLEKTPILYTINTFPNDSESDLMYDDTE